MGVGSRLIRSWFSSRIEYNECIFLSCLDYNTTGFGVPENNDILT